MCIDKASEFHTVSTLLPAVRPGETQNGAIGQQNHAEEEQSLRAPTVSSPDSSESTEVSSWQEGSDVNVMENRSANAHPDLPLDGGGSRSTRADETERNMFARCMTSRILADNLLEPERVAILGRSSNKSCDFWRWCIGMMVSSSAQQWQSTMSALSMHR